MKLPADNINEIITKDEIINLVKGITDADPDVLADYIIALLKHDSSIEQLKDMCINQLIDFLGQGITFYTLIILYILHILTIYYLLFNRNYSIH